MSDRFSLDELLVMENPILIDSSICKDKGASFAREIYDTRKFSEINPDRVNHELECTIKIIEILQADHVYTIEEVADEMREYNRIISEKINNLSANTRLYGHGKYNSEIRSAEKAKGALQALQKALYNLWQTARSKDYKKNHQLNHEQHNLFVEMIKVIDRAIGLKKDTGYMLGEPERDRSYESDTDEKLAALLYCLSMEGKKPALVSKDTDFVRLLGVCTRLLQTRDFYPQNSEFIQALKQNPFRFYFENSEQCELILKSEPLEYNHPDFWIDKKDYQKNREIKEQVLSLWQKLTSLENDTAYQFSVPTSSKTEHPLITC